MQLLTVSLTPGGGNGSHLVLGPSLGTNVWTLWSSAVERLGHRFSLAGWDLPGHGASAVPDEPFEMSDLADAVIREADRHGIDRFHYAGSSIGGAVGLELALRYRERLASVTTVCSGARLGSEELWRDRAAQVRLQGTASLVESSAARWFAPDRPDDEASAKASLLAALPELNDEGYAKCCEALRRFDVRDSIVGLSTPLLAVAAEHDLAAPASGSEELARLVADGRSVVIAGAAHLAVAEKPDEIAGAITEFAGGIE